MKIALDILLSEEHLRNWAQFDPAAEDGIISLPHLLKLFSNRMFRRRLDPDYFSHMREYAPEFMSTLHELGVTNPFWSIPKR